MATNSLVPFYGEIYGPLYFSTLISTGLYSALCVQMFYYYVHYPDDPLRMKIFVAALWALDTIHEALTVAGVYKYIIASLADPSAVFVVMPELASQVLSVALVAGPVQTFFMYRLYCYGKEKIRSTSKKIIVIPLLWAILSIYQIVASILYVARALYSVDGTIRVVGAIVITDSFFTTLSASTLGLSAAIDVLIAIGMTFLLLRTDTDFSRTKHVLQRLAMLAINTGIWTATFAVLAIILLRALPRTVLHSLFDIPLSSLYCNMLLANLNVRTFMRDGLAGNHEGSGEIQFVSPNTHIPEAKDRGGDGCEC